MPNREVGVGDIVMQKASGHWMVVVSVSGASCECTWYTNQVMQRGTFDRAKLQLVHRNQDGS